MDITPALAAGRSSIDGYGPGLIRVRGTAYHTPLLVFPTRLEVWNPPPYAALTPAHLASVFAEKPEVLLLGVGATFSALPPAELRAACAAARIVLEAMGTGAACRTFNVLLAEGRAVAAALYLP